MFDWDDLRIFIAAARAGSLAAAGQKLGIDTATVGRRVSRLETVLKCTLVVRSPTGLQLTAVGAQLADIALDVETAIESATRVANADLVAGTVRISTAEGFGTAVLAPALPALAQARPSLRIELAASPGFLSPSRREVDMAVTLSPPGDPRLVVEPLATYQLALYASPEHLARIEAPRTVLDLDRLQIVSYVGDLIYAPELRYLEEISPELTAQLASSSIQAQKAIIAAGGGIGVLPCFMADGLVRVLADEVLIVRRFWLSTHRDVHDTARIRSVARWLRELVADQRDRLSPY